MFPWLAQGHINPFVHLSRGLAQQGVKVSFLSTPVNISRVKPLLQHHRIELLELPLPFVDGLPSGAESTADIPKEMTSLLHKAFDGLEKPFQILLQCLSPDYVMHDLVHCGTPRVAAKLGIPTIVFVVYNPMGCGYMLAPDRRDKERMTVEELSIPPPNYPSSPISWRVYEARSILGVFKGNIIDRAWECFDGCCAIAIKSCFEMEDKYMEYIQRFTGKPVISVGPLLPDLPKQGAGGEDEESFCLRWLEKQQRSSVVFVSFGSESFLTKEQIHQLALGLEASRQPFLWSLRFPRQSDEGDQEARVRASSLPEGFESRSGERGIVVGGWLPQPKILSHPSIGCYLTHSGWSSVMEALCFGLPLVLLPIKIDQPLNARQVADELKTGVEIDRGCDGSFSKEEICKCVRLVMVEEEGKRVRSKAEEMRNTILLNHDHQQEYIQNFIQHLNGFASTKTL
eukprot:Gb_33790 [translate_table: standard]